MEANKLKAEVAKDVALKKSYDELLKSYQLDLTKLNNQTLEISALIKKSKELGDKVSN